MNGIIVGAGIGGLSTAIAMRKRHIDVKIKVVNISWKSDKPDK